MGATPKMSPPMKIVYVYRCPICKKDVPYHIDHDYPPYCYGPENTHEKKMEFVPERSTETPRYLLTTKKQSTKIKPTTKEHK